MIAVHRSLGDRLEEFALRLDRGPLWIAGLLAAVYLLLIAPSVGRHLGYDELHTLYIAQAASLDRLAEEVRVLDLQPPLSFLLVRGSTRLFGPNELGTRLPAMLCSFVGSVAAMVFIGRRAGSLWGAAGAGLFWISDLFYLTTTARPYGILTGFLGAMLVSWDYVSEGGRARPWAIAGIATGALGMLSSHVFAVLWIIPFWAAEVLRNCRQRRIDYAVWGALLLPLTVCITYRPLLQNVAHTVFPPEFRGSVELVLAFYLLVVLKDWPALLLAGLASLAVFVWRRRSSAELPEATLSSQARFHAPELVLLAGSLLPPAMLNVISAFGGIAFYGRYAFPTILTANLLLVLLLARRMQNDRLCGLVAASVILGFALFAPAIAFGKTQAGQSQLPIDFDQVHPDLPFVVNSAFTFLEMDHYERTALVKRMYYLVDEESALKYSHSNVTEAIGKLKGYFPIRSNVERYAEFIASHKHFLVWGEPGEQQGWLLTKLKAEGAGIRDLGLYRSPYPDSRLYEVRMEP